TPAREAVPHYFSEYEAKMDLPIIRPVNVARVAPAEDGYRIELSKNTPASGKSSPYAGTTWHVDAVINATGTWNNPNKPQYPGIVESHGRHCRSEVCVRMEVVPGHRVRGFGGGISAVPVPAEASDVAAPTFSYARSQPFFRA